MLIIIKTGTPRLITDRIENSFGEIYGTAKPTNNNIAKI